MALVHYWRVMASLPIMTSVAANRQELARRWALAVEPCPEQVSSPPLKLLLRELDWMAEPVRRKRRGPLEIATSDNPKTVMMLPGFAAHPLRMRYMARQIERAGHTVKRWGLGLNLGPTQERFDVLEKRLADICTRYEGKVTLVGWSLGGIFARELAKRHPQCVDKVITMGSPFSGSQRANNAWRAYQFVTGHRVDSPPIEADIAGKPPVETVALWSPCDGVVSPRSACGRPGERDRAIALRCTHMGFSFSPEAIRAVLAEL